MMYLQHLWLYVLLVTGIILVPGMDMLFVLANALTGGARAGLAATAGIMLGGVCHTLIGFAAVAVLSRMIPVVASAMLAAGSLYMMWIGITLMRSRITVDGVGAARPKPALRIAVQGLFTCLVNPKAWMFVLSVFPQFMKPQFGPLVPQAAAMGAITVLVQGLVYGGMAIGAVQARRALVHNTAATVRVGQAAGALLAAIAAVTLFQAVASPF